MSAPIIIEESMDLWVSNGAKDLFCEVVVAVAKLKGNDVSAVYEVAPGIAGTYGVSGVGIDTAEFYPYFGGRTGFRRHLDDCLERLSEVPDLEEPATTTMAHLLEWAKHVMDGGAIGEHVNVYNERPPGNEA
jgi:hypothetical protein